jgi:hypothetical protein
MKLTEYTYGCNSLTNFEFEAHAKTGNGNRVIFFDLPKKNILKSQVFGGF